MEMGIGQDASEVLAMADIGQQTFAEWECLVIIIEAGIRETEQVRPSGWQGVVDELDSVHHSLTTGVQEWLN